MVLLLRLWLWLWLLLLLILSTVPSAWFEVLFIFAVIDKPLGGAGVVENFYALPLFIIFGENVGFTPLPFVFASSLAIRVRFVLVERASIVAVRPATFFISVAIVVASSVIAVAIIALPTVAVIFITLAVMVFISITVPFFTVIVAFIAILIVLVCSIE